MLELEELAHSPKQTEKAHIAVKAKEVKSGKKTREQDKKERRKMEQTREEERKERKKGSKKRAKCNPLVVAADTHRHRQTDRTDTLTHKLFWTPTQ